MIQRGEVDVAIIGGGPAGLAAALAAQEQGASVLLMERDVDLGGILNQCIHNGFGLHYFGEELTGPEYAHRFIEKVKSTSNIVTMTDTFVLSIDKNRHIQAISDEYGLFGVRAKAIVLAMGCRERTRGALSIPGTRPAGVYTAGTAQRLVNIENLMPGSRVVVLGSGDIGMIMARRMAWEGATVEMVCELQPFSSGLNRNIVQCLNDNDIPLHFSTTVVQIHGDERIEGVTIAQVDDQRKPLPETERFIPCDTLLLSVGLIPENELSIEAGIALDAVTAGPIVNDSRQTEAEGIFACGNVLHVHDLVDNVSAEAAIAGAAAARYALGQASQARTSYRVTAGEGVRYVLPHTIASEGEGKLDLYLRVSDVYKAATLCIQCGDKQIVKRKKRILSPGEMEKITIDRADIQGDITLHIMQEGV